MSDPRFIQDGFTKRLSHVIEETGELIAELGGVLAAAGKTQRWGPDSVNPLLPEGDRETNINWLRRELRKVRPEMQDLTEAMDRFEQTVAVLYGR